MYFLKQLLPGWPEMQDPRDDIQAYVQWDKTENREGPMITRLTPYVLKICCRC